MTVRSFSGRLACAAALALLAGTAARAHVTLEQQSADAGSTHKAVFRIGHGCAGAATHTVVVHLPEGLPAARPMPKAGWALERQPADGPTRQIAWRGGPLPDGFYDEFVLQLRLPPQPGPLWFRVEQHCEGGAVDWAEVPASGTDTRGLKHPAALLNARPPASAAAHQH